MAGSVTYCEKHELKSVDLFVSIADLIPQKPTNKFNPGIKSFTRQ
jgi:hypothetical protein